MTSVTSHLCLFCHIDKKQPKSFAHLLPWNCLRQCDLIHWILFHCLAGKDPELYLSLGSFRRLWFRPWTSCGWNQSTFAALLEFMAHLIKSASYYSQFNVWICLFFPYIWPMGAELCRTIFYIVWGSENLSNLQGAICTFYTGGDRLPGSLIINTWC